MIGAHAVNQSVFQHGLQYHGGDQGKGRAGGAVKGRFQIFAVDMPVNIGILLQTVELPLDGNKALLHIAGVLSEKRRNMLHNFADLRVAVDLGQSVDHFHGVVDEMRIDLGLQRAILVFQHFILRPVLAGLLLPHLRQQPLLMLQHSVEVAGQFACFIAADHRYPKLQISGGRLVHRTHQQMELPGHAVGDHQYYQRTQHRADQAGQDAGQRRRTPHLPQDGFR